MSRQGISGFGGYDFASPAPKEQRSEAHMNPAQFAEQLPKAAEAVGAVEEGAGIAELLPLLAL